ncbi:[Fe-S]-binding protein [Virgibacillus phasianinus]|uniref:Methylated-DNA--protein-cysteine methyltransferase n=1 Tax=Virgibacillus phasianinus TaxID=2017483 RepID=A0A220TYV7_9BACI|nr:methylated-DNA--[protein]-cysteine S-methyltransferase [Virgibacillus phasianinus]ASK60935.1 [Fe-S]-binding protein [Virgibacillus phasianinus]
MEQVRLYYDEMDSPIGILTLISNGEKLVRIEYGELKDRGDQMDKWLIRYFGDVAFIHSEDKMEPVINQLQAYFNEQKRDFTLDFEFNGTPFQQKVWQALVDNIPYGETRSYKDIAVAIGNPKAVRAVGGAVNKNPFSIIVPCHRVIGVGGQMVGYNGGLDKKEYLLAHEKHI